MKLDVYTDGWSRGNPGIAGLWVAIYDENGVKKEARYKTLGVKTNNEAEYLWAYYGIKRAIELWADEITLFMDSKLVIEQLLGNWKIKKGELKQIHTDIQDLLKENKILVDYQWVPREQNKEADRLSNTAMDAQ